MEIYEVKTRKDKKDYIGFIYNLYKDDRNFSDMNIIFIKNFLYQKDSYSKRCNIIPILIKDKGLIRLECIFVIDETEEIKLSFLEFLPHAKKYLKELIDYSKKLLKKYNKEKIVVGINGQISYGLGILTNKYNRNFEFNSNYNKDYYTKELDNVFHVVKKAYSYKYDAQNSLNLLNKSIIDNVNKSYEFRFLDMKHFKRDMLIFGELCHKSLKSTPYYSKKTPYEMYELMKQMKFIMKKEDIIFAIKDGEEIGFVYTHPDYSELFDKPRLYYIRFYLRYLFRKPNNLIYNIICVDNKYQISGVSLALIYKSIMLRKDNYPKGVSSFILEDNTLSTNLCKKLSVGINKEFHLYEIGCDQDV